jgi:iron(III) transport system substrate-binding protein
MKRYIWLILFAIVLIAPFIVRWATGASRVVEPPADAIKLVIVTPNTQEIRHEFGRAFEQWHQDHYHQLVSIDFRTPGGANDIQRLIETTYAAKRVNGKLPPESEVTADIDLVWGGGDFMFDVALKPMGVLSTIDIPDEALKQAFPSPTLAGVKLYDYSPPTSQPSIVAPRPRWIGTCLASFGIVYNPDVYASLHLPAPTRWSDLGNEKLSGRIALADPTHSASAAIAYMMVIQRAMADAEEELFTTSPNLKSMSPALRSKDPQYQSALAIGWKNGMRELVLIAANARYFTDSAPLVPNDVGNGEAAAGMSIDFYGRVYQQSVGPARCRFIAPHASTSITPDPIAILYGVKGTHREIATHFIEFLLTPGAQRLWQLPPGAPGGPVNDALRRMPIRRDVYTDKSNWTDPEINPFDDAAGFNQRGEWMGLFTELRFLWSAAWIDSRDDLKSAYAAILNVQDPEKHVALLTELSDLPITLNDVIAMHADRIKQQSAGTADRWRAAAKIDWSNRFRAHYQAIAAKAD